MLFDLDGTLVDSMWMWEAIDIEFLGAYGYECPDDIQRAIEGMSFSETAVYFKERFDLPLSLDEIKAVWTRMSIDKYRHEVPLKPGVLEFLKYCKENGIRTGIGTSNGSEIVDAVLTSLNVKAGGRTETKLVMRENKDEVQVIGNFNSESLFTTLEGGNKQSLLQACGRGYFVVGILGVNQEPTNHTLRDISALKADLEKWGRKLVLLFPNQEQAGKYRAADFSGLPNTVIYGIDTEDIAQQIVKNMKLKHKDTLPIFIIADTFNRVVFVSQGYTIGLGEQLMKTVKGL